MKYTPAPWTVETYIKKHGTQLVIQGPELSEGEHEIIAIVHERGNAQLIAAAPLMYKELERAMKTLYMLSVSFPDNITTGARNASNDIKAVLAKATS